MRADRLTRKSHLKKHSKPFGDVAVFDLTRGDEAQGQAALLMDVAQVSYASADEIAALPFTFEESDHTFAWAASMMAHSPTAARLWREAAQAGWSVNFADLKTGGFYLDLDAREIMLDHFALSPSALGRSAYFRNAFLLTFIRALREIWHEARLGALENQYGPEDVLMIERARAADADTVTVLAAWELRGAGFADIWRHLIGTEEGDMALVFSRFLERDPSALFDGSALAYAFRQWYVDAVRVNGIDHQTLEALDEIMNDADGRAVFGSRTLIADAIEALSELPDGSRYLRGLGQTIKSDPFFAGLGDPINQTHLFHLVYDTKVVMVNNVPFRDLKLARRIFPDGEIARLPN